jgi:hypothetical protein
MFLSLSLMPRRFRAVAASSSYVEFSYTSSSTTLSLIKAEIPLRKTESFSGWAFEVNSVWILANWNSELCFWMIDLGIKSSGFGRLMRNDFSYPFFMANQWITEWVWLQVTIQLLLEKFWLSFSAVMYSLSLIEVNQPDSSFCFILWFMLLRTFSMFSMDSSICSCSILIYFSRLFLRDSAWLRISYAFPERGGEDSVKALIVRVWSS